MKIKVVIKNLCFSLLGIFCCLLFLSNFLFISFINITPFSKFQLLSIVVLTVVIFLSLSPWHELGHYNTAKQFALSKEYNVLFYLKRNYISCSDWSVFSDDEKIQILKSGVSNKITFCIWCIIVALFTYNFIFAISFIYVIILEYASNCIPTFKGCDYYYIHHLDEFVNEEKKMNNIKEDNFIKFYYPHLLKICFFIYALLCFILLFI